MHRSKLGDVLEREPICEPTQTCFVSIHSRCQKYRKTELWSGSGNARIHVAGSPDMPMVGQRCRTNAVWIERVRGPSDPVVQASISWLGVCHDLSSTNQINGVRLCTISTPKQEAAHDPITSQSGSQSHSLFAIRSWSWSWSWFSLLLLSRTRA